MEETDEVYDQCLLRFFSQVQHVVLGDLLPVEDAVDGFDGYGDGNRRSEYGVKYLQ